jgi:hypothetical protein
VLHDLIVRTKRLAVCNDTRTVNALVNALISDVENHIDRCSALLRKITARRQA